ncbi:MAG: Unsaturated chondroitin disaccharide hydrolase [Nitrosomonadaceae bacterium]|nr:Unsaturated chondroitin disaccharide hydrolase [Nitrosomonadaceae bacterium]
MLLPLMWAKDQDRSLADSARLHHDNILRFGLVRSDFSTWQRLEFAPGSWEPGSPHTIQGFRDTSTWTRGQAWAIHSFTSAYEAYRVEKYLDTALGLVQWFLMKLGNDLVPPYDFDDPDNANGPRDSCTAAIVANALLRLAVLHPPSRAEFRHQASRILAELVTNYLTSGGVLLHGSWGRAKRRFNLGRFPQEDVMPYGNYWIAEALFRWQCEDWAILSLGG